uniref:Alternative protein CYTH4 n=1 Tax=Homo sapiens TaxID=9606 RepID=L8E9K5_HUMAN|nr:alternative protein CYTH4 [Homo sapiens]
MSISGRGAGGTLKKMTENIPDRWDSSRMGAISKKPRRESFVHCG